MTFAWLSYDFCVIFVLPVFGPFSTPEQNFHKEKTIYFKTMLTANKNVEETQQLNNNL